ncbi:phosphoribosylformylglycinamidine cyclo-ligase [Phycisphaerales bacterium AB-hyl4]|uniref:Phosphoribosylformylglycinamidine cyclo-ligase n=1 Tax=Natronomicrosphaera hydrolytica TaxID=3242702 RepID=A0ABV4U129_9BACT
MADSRPPAKPMTYAGAGVDIDAGDRMVNLIEHHMRRTYGPRVLGKHGAFAGCFRLDFNERLFQRNYRDPVLVSCTDGVGTKVKLAAQMNIHDTVGQDLVAMNVNDLIVQGAEPLFFLDYIGIHKLTPELAAAIVKGVADGCELAGCALLGGETAEMPDVYAEGDFDLAGFAVGVCEMNRMIDGSRTEPGDVILGLASSGVHSNGYSLVRAVIKEAGLDLNKVYDELETDEPLGRVLLEPTRIYAKSVVSTLRHYTVKQVVSAMSHITGGGMVDNIPRTLGDTLDAVIDRKSWDVPPIFKLLQQRGNVEEDEMLRVFNMGVGYILTVRPYFAEAIADRLAKAGETVYRLGELVPGSGEVKFR